MDLRDAVAPDVTTRRQAFLRSLRYGLALDAWARPKNARLLIPNLPSRSRSSSRRASRKRVARRSRSPGRLAGGSDPHLAASAERRMDGAQ
jgi:hypothetical protein